MVDVNVDPFEGWEQEPVPISVIVGYAYQYLPDYISWTDPDGEAFMPTLLSVLDVESGFNQFIKSNVEGEASYGLFQIHWPSAKSNEYGTGITQQFPQFEKFNKNVSEMTPEEYQEFLPLITDLNFQFTWANILMNQGKKDGLIFQDWSAYNNGSYKTKINLHNNEWASIKNNPKEFYSSARDGYTPNPQWNNVTNFGGDLEGFEPADTGMQDNAPVTNEDKWKAVKAYYGGQYYDIENDQWLEGYQGYSGYQEWLDKYGNFLDDKREDPENSSVSDYLNNTFDQGKILFDEWNSVSKQEGFLNPFSLNNLRRSPSTADIVMSAVYNRFLRSAQNAGFGSVTAQMTTLGHLAHPSAINKMRRLVTQFQASYPNGDMQEMIDHVAEGIANGYANENNQRIKWGFNMPSFKDANAQEIQGMNQQIGDTVSSVLLGDYPNLTDKIRNAWRDYRIVNPNTSVSLNDFAMPFIKKHQKYNQIYLRKPKGMSESNYISQYQQAVGSAMSTGNQAYNRFVQSGASMGSTQQEAYTSARFGGGAKVSMGDAARNDRRSIIERIGGMFNG